MKIFYIVLAVIILYLAVVFIRFKYVISHANLADIVPQDRSIGTGPKLKYIAAGDSTAVGEGADSIEKTYTYRLADYFAEKHSVEYKNIGVLGAKTSDVLTKQLSAIIVYDPDVITISVGANDLTHWKSTSEIIGNYKSIIDAVTRNTKAKIYLTNIAGVDRAKLIPLPYRKTLEYHARKLNKELLTLETDRVKIVDIHDFGWSAYPDLSVTFARDMFHPNDEGYNNWTKAFLSKIRADFP